MARLQSRKEAEQLRQMEEMELLRLVEEQRVENKKENNEARKLQEAEDKRKKDEEEEIRNQTKEAADAATTAEQDKEQGMEEDIPDGNFNKNLHDVFNGVTTETEPTEGKTAEEQQDECSPPAKKRSGSSKIKHNPNKVSPPEAASESTKKKISFEKTYIHPHKRVIIELAILLKSDKTFEKFAKALMVFIENTQMVDPKFVINTLNPMSKEKKHHG